MGTDAAAVALVRAITLDAPPPPPAAPAGAARGVGLVELRRHRIGLRRQPQIDCLATDAFLTWTRGWNSR
jgi:hypothetical protein